MWKFFELFFKRDKRNRKDFNKGYLDGVYFPDKHLPLLKKELLEMQKSNYNLKKHKARTQGFLLGYQDRRKARLAELEQIKQKSQSNERSRER